jgi:hypothetical protein
MASGADIAIAIGTIATAAIALAGLAVSLLINHRDRDRADKQADLDRKAASERAAADRAAMREDAQRRHIIDLLLELGRELGNHAAHTHGEQGAQSVQRVTMLLNALPAECAVTTRKRYDVERTKQYAGAVGVKMSYLDLSSFTPASIGLQQMITEIAYDIDRYMTAGLAPDLVWSSIPDIESWQRERWPNR